MNILNCPTNMQKTAFLQWIARTKGLHKAQLWAKVLSPYAQSFMYEHGKEALQYLFDHLYSDFVAATDADMPTYQVEDTRRQDAIARRAERQRNSYAIMEAKGKQLREWTLITPATKEL